MKLKTDIEIKWLDQDETRDYIEDLHDHITTPDHWAESVKMADEINGEVEKDCDLEYVRGEYFINYERRIGITTDSYYMGPFTLPELRDKLISLRESEGE